MSKAVVLKLPENSVNLSSPTQLAEFATVLKQFIVTKKLFTQIQGKNYVNVEGWQFAGATMGVLPVIKALENLSNDTEIKYRAEIELRSIANDQVVGFGVAICSNKETKRRGADEYVIASMAQTRATGKAYRNGFGWLMKMAGYEGTPAEEVPGGDVGLEGGNDDELVTLTDYEEKLRAATDIEALKSIWNDLPALAKTKLVPVRDELKKKLAVKDAN